MKTIALLLLCLSANAFEHFGASWPQREITYQCEPALQKACTKAVKAWNATGAVNLTEADSGAGIQIAFAEMHYGYLGQSFVSLKDRWITGARVEINPAHRFKGWRSYDLPSLIAHEIGHCLGLGHSNDPRAVMYSHAEFQKRLKLGADDVTGIMWLYRWIMTPIQIPAPRGYRDYYCLWNQTVTRVAD